MAKQIIADEILNAQAASHLLDELRAADGTDISIDVSSVKHLGAQALQVLLAARKSMDAAGHKLLLDAPSMDFVNGLKSLGAENHFSDKGQTE